MTHPGSGGHSLAAGTQSQLFQFLFLREHRVPALTNLTLCAAVLALGVLAAIAAMVRARASSNGDLSTLHSRLPYYGAYAGLWTALPALIAVALWSAGEPIVLRSVMHSHLPPEISAKPLSERTMIDGAIGSLASGLNKLAPGELEQALSAKKPLVEVLSAKGVALGTEPQPFQVDAAQDLNKTATYSRLCIAALALALALAGLLISVFRVRASLRARNGVEGIILAGLMAASTVAILTTVGIVLSMLFETIHFFGQVPASNFFFGTTWDPRFSAAGSGGASGQFGLLPLLWGTAYISAVALAVAVPVGLMSAIYMSEYASKRVRTFVKPVLELLAGIPTIVYGLFALISFGPFLRDLGANVGVSVSASSVLTAGFVMGIMLIPFVSSLSDDVINAVPQVLRDGSLGLGATKSETIKQVVLPAALPGVIGAVLLAASRAIGETMIVVLAAGIAANMTLNPLQPVTTITVKIVSQLTGDLEFNSPQTLVAFALGLTLFFITLLLNIYALSVVRRFREHYE